MDERELIPEHGPRMNTFFLFILPVCCGSFAIWYALRFGEIAAGGSTVYREKTPLMFWTAVALLVFVVAGLVTVRVIGG